MRLGVGSEHVEGGGAAGRRNWHLVQKRRAEELAEGRAREASAAAGRNFKMDIFISTPPVKVLKSDTSIHVHVLGVR